MFYTQAQDREHSMDIEAAHCDSCNLPINQGDLYITYFRYEDRDVLCSCPEDIVTFHRI